MAAAWDSTKWLISNYKNKNGIPGFFMEGGYKAQHKLIIEEEFQKTVNLIAEQDEIKDAKEWVERTTNSGYLCLELDTAMIYWAVTTRNQTNYIKEKQVDKHIFKHTTVSDFEQKHCNTNSRKFQESDASKEPLLSRRRIEASESNVFASIIRTAALNREDQFLNLSARDQYFVTCGLNNIIDLTDMKREGHMSALTEEQRDTLNAQLSHSYQYTQLKTDFINDSATKKMVQQKNWSNVLKKAYSKLETAADDEFPVIKFISYVLEQHLRYPENMTPEVLERLSENSLIVNFWSTIIEATFCGSKLIPNWGDTISLGLEKTNRKMDLRIVYDLTNNNNLGNAEFGKIPTETKYFNDKAKLVMNGKTQLNNLIRATNDKSIVMALLIIQGLQAEVLTISLVDNGLYALEIVEIFQFPRLSSFIEDVNRLLIECSALKSICVDTQRKYEDTMVKKMSKMNHGALFFIFSRAKNDMISK